ncbi:pyridoxal phosphate-dependent aminotransferase [Candidatus Atribacteria bacterium 1244-E10-H5-B2]|nr:MAG: pyridoxal phosphate-dependent aminotransferase [Candidatus Atribacteria bacterium 1244-E10-H5-B2]
MKNFLNIKSVEMKKGAIRAMFDRAKKFPGSINLGIGEPDLNTPAEVVEEGCKALRSGKTRYTANAGIIELRTEMAKHLNKYNLSVNPENEIIVTIGGMGALALCLLVTITPGDEVLLQDPQWLNYFSQIKFCGGIPISVPVYEENEFKISPESIKKRITNRTKILMLNSPNNPTGAVLDYDDLENIASLAKEYKLLVISDEVYSTFVYDGVKHHSIASIGGMLERTIVINSFSKSFAMTGWRIGFAAGNSQIIEKMVRLQENLVACVNASSQYAAIKALSIFNKTNKTIEIYKKKRNLIVDELNNIRGISCYKPKGSFYVFPNVRKIGKNSKTVANELLEKANVVTIPGSAFGPHGEGYLRISYANSEENIREAVKRIKKYIENLA